MTRKPKIAPKKVPKLFPVVGIGASAGGLDPLKELFENLPKHGLACVVIQHLDPSHESLLADILSRHTQMKVAEAKEGTQLEINCVYTIPPNTEIGFVKHRLHLKVRKKTAGGLFLPIDGFFQSLASSYGSRAIGIILSGSGSDGALGLQEIKQQGGITFAQNEASAKFSSMPSNAIATGAVDFILSPKEIGRNLQNLLQKKYWMARPISKHQLVHSSAHQDSELKDVISVIHKSGGVDFSNYKFPTVSRRIQRRMALKGISNLADYRDLLKTDAAESGALSQDILIQVTKFFRDEPSFNCLKEEIFPSLVKDRASGDPIRIWVPGCSSGEELYSILMSLSELMNETGLHFPIQLFGTDLSDAAILKARAGTYLENAMTNVSPERIRRFFTKTGNLYEINKSLRDSCIFAKHNILKDPPFAKIDLISCQNVLIYFDSELQKRVLSIFHYALKASGVLVLGPAETTGAQPDLFRAFKRGSRAYSKVPTKNRLYFDFVGTQSAAERVMGSTAPQSQVDMISKGSQVQKESDRILLSEYAPPGVIITDNLEIIQFRGQSGPYFEHSPGLASLELFKMLKDELVPVVRNAILKARKKNERVREENVRVHFSGEVKRLSIELIPLRPADELYFLLVFEDMDSPNFEVLKQRRDAKKLSEESVDSSEEVTRLKAELTSTKDYLQSVNEEKGAANEELRAANEEIMSSNEELQSTNEELHTAKEELQSTNEELMTVNDELQSRNKDLANLSNDLSNLFVSLDAGVVMLSRDFRIRRFTAMAEKLLKLIPTDIGRSINDIQFNIKVKNLDSLLSKVLRNSEPIRLESQDGDKMWYSIEIRPYRTSDERIDGLVLIVTDITPTKTSLEYAEAVEETVGKPLVVLTGDLKVMKANKKFYQIFKATPKQTLNRFIYDLGNGQWDIPKLRILLEKILPKNSSFSDFEVTHKFPKIGKKTLRLNGRRLSHSSTKAETILIVFDVDP